LLVNEKRNIDPISTPIPEVFKGMKDSFFIKIIVPKVDLFSCRKMI